MNRTPLVALLLGCVSLSSWAAQASTIVPISQQLTVDSDGDGLVDLLDNAPGTSNPSQVDTDNDGIGDDIDPTPVNSNPNLGDPLLILGVPVPITAGSNANFSYLTLNTPPGSWGRIELDFDLDTSADAIYFGPLSSSTNTLSIPASLYVGSSWDLYTPGTYFVGMRVFAPGMSSQGWAQPFINVQPVPEPGSLTLAGLGAAMAVAGCRRRRSR